MPPNRKMAHGKPCPYCDRKMERGHPRLAPTWDHYVPASKGGRAKIIACIECNNIKGDMMPETWAAYMLAVPMWWTLTRLERRAIARANSEGVRSAKWGPRRSRQGSPPAGPVVVPPALVYGPETDAELVLGRPSRGAQS